MQVEMSQDFDRPPNVVFRFLVADHIANHPRWDPQMELWPITDGPIRLGSVIGRRQSRGAVPTEGTMEVVEFEPDRSVGWLVHDGPFAIRSSLSFEPIEAGRTRMTIRTELPDSVKAFDPSFMERSLRNMKSLIEAET
jgi:uncharacterized protein YndB with AHSA1/START domain